MTVSAAESCTGGMIAARLTNNSGSSLCFKQAVISYSNESKISMLNVKEETLKQFGAVSENTADEMLTGILNLSGWITPYPSRALRAKRGKRRKTCRPCFYRRFI
jgi:nicotinamide-nucleotide amidase